MRSISVRRRRAARCRAVAAALVLCAMAGPPAATAAALELDASGGDAWTFLKRATGRVHAVDGEHHLTLRIVDALGRSDTSTLVFRVDASWGVRERAPEFWPRWRAELKRIDPDLLLIAEGSPRDGYCVSHGFDAAYDWTDRLGEWA